VGDIILGYYSHKEFQGFTHNSKAISSHVHARLQSTELKCY